MKRFLKRACLWGGATVLVALITGLILQWVLSYRSTRSSSPGELVDVDGRRVHLLCEGSGNPTVVLEAGLPAFSLTWASITSEIATFTRVCAHDRAGYGWSEAGPTPRTGGRIAEELKVLLENAEIEPPYVLVGHSFGGLVVQIYASRFPDDVAGVVFVDSSHPDLAQRSGALAELDTVSSVLRLAPTGLPRLFLPLPAGSPTSREESVQLKEKEMLTTTRSLQAMASEMRSMRQTLAEALEQPDLGDKPLVVLTEGRRRAEFWHDMQKKLVLLSTTGRQQVVENAGHFIHHDQPQIVVDAVRRVVEEARTR